MAKAYAKHKLLVGESASLVIIQEVVDHETLRQVQDKVGAWRSRETGPRYNCICNSNPFAMSVGRS
jgi:hypothetical protein